MNRVREGLLRPLLFFEVIRHVPTYTEWIGSWQNTGGEVPDHAALILEAQALLDEGLVRLEQGRVTRSSFVYTSEELIACDAVLPRKQRRLRWVMRWLRHVPGMRAVFICNSTGFLNATDTSDLDFFCIVRHGALWQARLWATIPFLLLRLRPGDRRGERDAVCLSFFVTDRALDLTPLTIERDVYMAHWFRSLIPLYDDGIGYVFWEANVSLRSMLPCASRWESIPDQPKSRGVRALPGLPGVEILVRWFQRRYLPPFSFVHATSVVVTDAVLKFHVDDARLTFRDTYELLCSSLGIHS